VKTHCDITLQKLSHGDSIWLIRKITVI